MGNGSLSKITPISELLSEDLYRDRSLNGIELLEPIYRSEGWQDRLRGPTEPMLRWLKSLESRGVSLENLHIRQAALEQIEVSFIAKEGLK
ncbi:hypothetical protein J1G36_27475, partial [Pseudomonas carnis]|uniref:hypothetical protein n=1 Tax=Pseudomonas carnis TaxID=2487355 RepID=UPI001CA72B80